MILGGKSIEERLNAGQIFRQGTWEKSSIKEASYALRVAKDGIVVGGKIYEPEKDCYSEPSIEIEPGRIAILSTIERLCMPEDLAGKLGMRLDYASRGLTGLMGIQVDPGYGQNHSNERLFIKVANFGNETVKVSPGDAIFNIEFSKVENSITVNKPSTWERIKRGLANQETRDWTYMTKVNFNAQDIESQVIQRITGDVDSIRQGQQSVVLFGVFLVSITILGAMLGLLLSVDNAPTWVAEWGWVALFVLFFVATGAITWFVVIVGWGFMQASKSRQAQEKEPRRRST